MANSKQPVAKRKEAQKMAQTVLASIQTKYSEEESATEKHVAALESAFGSLEIKSNWHHQIFSSKHDVFNVIVWIESI